MKLKIIFFLLFGLLLGGVTACLNDDDHYNDFSKVGHVVEFLDAVSGATDVVNAAVPYKEDGTNDSIWVRVNVTGSNPAPEDITVTIALDVPSFNTLKDTIEAFNAKNLADAIKFHVDPKPRKVYTLMPDQYFTIPSQNVLVKANERVGKLLVVIHKPNEIFALPFNFVVPIRITDASGKTISGNLNSIMLNVPIQNIYDGVYTVSGSITRNSAAGPDTKLGGTYDDGTTMELETLAANENSIIPIWITGGTVGGIGNTSIIIDQTTNLVTVQSADNPALKNTVGAGIENKYDPATKTFTLNFDWGGGANTRIAKLKLVYKGPRKL
jgi:hypothetical protein